MSSELAENNMELDTPLKKRLYQLMTDDEKLLPFSFANRIGISKSTFHSIWTKGSTSIHKSTAKKIADATGVNVDWLHKGIGEPYSDGTQQAQHIEVDKAVERIQETVNAGTIDMTMMVEALTIVENYLIEHDKRMHADKKAELVVSIYDLLCKSPDSGSSIISMLKLAI
ncbi:helix-turn-helix domain-containing protein [Psychrobacter sp. AT9]|uniref:helix-turn-helix domain-containing protein n=1 Tax=Psychrobacter sp. AT9 TaxID=3242893 RepID=UPI0039A401FF